MSEFLLGIKSEIISWMDQGKYRKPAKMLADTLMKIDPVDITALGDLIAELMERNPKTFSEKVYNGFHFLIKKKVPSDLMYDLDEYIIDNYCLAEGEEILLSFLGTIRDKYSYILGRIFVTNYRIIASGFRNLTKASMKQGSKRLIGTVTLITRELIHYAIGITIQKALKKKSSKMQLLEYGYSYPYQDAYNVKKSKSSIKYNIKIEIERKNEIQVKRLAITIIPDKAFKEGALEGIGKIL